VNKVSAMIGAISSAAQEQGQGIEQINQAIAQMDQVTQQNASLVEEAAAASEAMQEQAAKLAEVVSVFRMAAATAPGHRSAITPVARARAPRSLPA
jgi:methyl-accepting chemotaxis protein